MEKIVQFIIVRTDLNMTHGKMAAQVAHASLKSVLPYQNDQHVKSWLSGKFTKIVLRVKNFNQLRKLCDNFKADGIIHKEIWDLCLTEIQRETESGTLTCVGLKPIPKSLVPKYINGLQLYV